MIHRPPLKNKILNTLEILPAEEKLVPASMLLVEQAPVLSSASMKMRHQEPPPELQKFINIKRNAHGTQ